MHSKMIRRPLSLSSSLSFLGVILTSAALPGSFLAVRVDGTPRHTGLPALAAMRAARHPGAGCTPCNVFWGERAPKRQRSFRRDR